MTAKATIQYEQLSKLIQQVDKTTGEAGAPGVGEFLACIMTGRDPRPIDSPLFTLVKRIAMRQYDMSIMSASMPNEFEWSEIVNIVLNSGLYQKAFVDVKQSQQAAEKLMEYLHAKMKSVELSGSIDHHIKIEPLTGRALEAFKDRFEEEY